LSSNAGEVRDIPFFKNDMNGSTATMGKPLDTADGPGKADAELGVEEPPPPGPPVAIDPDDAMIPEPTDDAFSK